MGVNNEPRNALILTFIIAELGILIGELNVIAELVAMFYMAAYLFINISCFLEQWSSPDFRPKFKIPISHIISGSCSYIFTHDSIEFSCNTCSCDCYDGFLVLVI